MEMELPSGQLVTDPSVEAVQAAIRALPAWEESVILRDEALGELSLCGPDGDHHYAQCKYPAGSSESVGECTDLSLHELLALGTSFLSGRVEWRDRMKPIPTSPRSSFVAKVVLGALALMALGFLLVRAA